MLHPAALFLGENKPLLCAGIEGG